MKRWYLGSENVLLMCTTAYTALLTMWHALVLNDRLDGKDSVDFHDHPPIPDNVLKEDDDKVRRPRSTVCRVSSC